MIMAFPLLNSGNFDNGIVALEQSLDEAMIDDALKLKLNIFLHDYFIGIYL